MVQNNLGHKKSEDKNKLWAPKYLASVSVFKIFGMKKLWLENVWGLKKLSVKKSVGQRKG